MKIYVLGQHQYLLTSVIHGFYQNHEVALTEGKKLDPQLIESSNEPPHLFFTYCWNEDDPVPEGTGSSRTGDDQHPVFCTMIEVHPKVKTMYLMRTILKNKQYKAEIGYYLYGTMNLATEHVRQLSQNYEWAIVEVKVQ